MSATNEKQLPKIAAKVYVATLPSNLVNLASNLSNVATLKAQIDALSLERIASVVDVQYIENYADAVKVETDDNGVIYNATVPTPRVTWNFYEVLNSALLSKIYGKSILNVAGTLVSGYSQPVVSGAWTYDNFIKFDFQNGDGSKITPTSVTAGTNGPLVLNTDYFIVQDDNGNWGIIVRDSTTVTTEAQSITIVYNYTPNAAKYVGNNIENTEIPRLVIVLRAIDPKTGKKVEIYLGDAVINSEVIVGFVNPKRAGGLTNSPFEFLGNEGGFSFMYTDNL